MRIICMYAAVVYDSGDTRNFEDISEITNDVWSFASSITIYKDDGSKVKITTQDQWEDFITSNERRIWLNPKEPEIKYTPRSPKHYKNYVEEIEWIDIMKRIPTLRKPERFIAALELQIRGYLDRREQKDDSVQELRKALFYMIYLTIYADDPSYATAERVHNIMTYIENPLKKSSTISTGD